jgi:putative transcriptional regulator
MESLRGHLLVASPALLDPNFRRAVVLVTEHSDDGAAGLVLNRPSPVEVAGAAPAPVVRAAVPAARAQ